MITIDELVPHLLDLPSFEEDLPPAPGSSLPRHVCKPVVIYDDLDAGHRARELIALMTRRFEDHVEVQPIFWRFDLLEQPISREQSLSDAAAAQRVFPFHSPTDSADEVEAAFAKEQSRRGRPAELRDQKTEQEVRKWQLANDGKLAGLVERDRVHERMGVALGHFDRLAVEAVEDGAKRMAAVAADEDVARCRQELRQIIKEFRDSLAELAHLFGGIQR